MSNDHWEIRPCKDRLGNVTSYDICLPQEPGSSGVAVVASVYSGEEVANQIVGLWNTRHESEPVTVLREALTVRDAVAAKCPIQRGYKDICPRCKATSSDTCGTIAGADYAFVERAREALARIGRSV